MSAIGDKFYHFIYGYLVQKVLPPRIVIGSAPKVIKLQTIVCSRSRHLVFRVIKLLRIPGSISLNFTLKLIAGRTLDCFFIVGKSIGS